MFSGAEIAPLTVLYTMSFHWNPFVVAMARAAAGEGGEKKERNEKGGHEKEKNAVLL